MQNYIIDNKLKFWFLIYYSPWLHLRYNRTSIREEREKMENQNWSITTDNKYKKPKLQSTISRVIKDISSSSSPLLFHSPKTTNPNFSEPVHLANRQASRELNLMQPKINLSKTITLFFKVIFLFYPHRNTFLQKVP